MKGDKLEFVYFSSEEPPKFSGFTGYAFTQENFIASKEISEIEVADGCEGAYVSWIKKGASIKFGTDWNGSGRWFLYKSSKVKSFWALSNSLLLLFENVRSRGMPTTIDQDMIDYWGFLGGFTQQLHTNETAVSEIYLVSRWENIELKTNMLGKKSISVIERARGRAVRESYEVALREYLSENLRIMRSLLTTGTDLYFDLSGGLDTRVTFSFASHLIKENQAFKKRIHVFSNRRPSFKKEFELASAIVKDLGMELEPRPGRDWSTYETPPLRRWELNRLGQYALSTTIGAASFDTGKVRISGGGGENYRDFWVKWGSSVEELMKRRKSILKRDNLNRCVISQRINKNLDRLMKFYPSNIDRLTVLYREFRGRFHTAIPATEEILLFPLSGRSMDSLADVAPEGHFKKKQVFYDIIYNLDRNLLNYDFDQESKQPTNENLENLTKVTFHKGNEPFSKVTFSSRYSSAHDLKASRSEFLTKILDFENFLPDKYRITHPPFSRKIEQFRRRGFLESQSDIQSLQFVYLVGAIARAEVRHSPVEDDQV